MSEHRKITKNVQNFLGEASKIYGEIQSERFYENMYCQLLERGIGSPIEDLFYIAINLQCEARHIKVNPDPEFERDGTIVDGIGVFISPQASIGKYRVDFFISRNRGKIYDITPHVIVELDGHDFHDKDKYQRTYEKSRDRFLVKQGHKVLHFAGSEIAADPHKAAFEVLSTLGEINDAIEYNSLNPLGRES